MSRYIWKSVLLLTLSIVICYGLYPLSSWVIGKAAFSPSRIAACLVAMTVELSIRARSRSRLRRTNIFSLARPPRLTMHQVRPRRQWLHRTTSSIRRIATSASQSLHCYSGRLKTSAIFMIVNDRASLFSYLRARSRWHITEGARSTHKHVGRRQPASTFRPGQRRR